METILMDTVVQDNSHGTNWKWLGGKAMIIIRRCINLRCEKVLINTNAVYCACGKQTQIVRKVA